MCNRIGGKLSLVGWEMLHHQCCQVSIFTEGQKILLVQGIEVAFGIFVDDTVRDEDRATFVCCADTV